MPAPDTIILGLGAFGSSIALHLARRAHKVVGLDRYAPPHTRGSSHGHSRIIRLCYSEHPSYVPLLRRAYSLWDELQRDAGEPLIRISGGLYLGAPDTDWITGARRAALEHGLAHEVLSPEQVQARWPVLRVPAGMSGFFEPTAGVLRPEATIAAQLRLAARAGADLRFDTRVLRWSSSRTGVEIHTEVGPIAAERLVIAAGAFAPALLARPLPLRVTRQTVLWTNPPAAAHASLAAFPIWGVAEGERFTYGFPLAPAGDDAGLLKVAAHHAGVPADPEGDPPEAEPAVIRELQSFLAALMPTAAGPAARTAGCYYTNTPDGHFVLDWLDEHRRVLLASPCSGHGFKFAPVLGELAARALTGEPDALPPLFRLDRFRA